MSKPPDERSLARSRHLHRLRRRCRLPTRRPPGISQPLAGSIISTFGPPSASVSLPDLHDGSVCHHDDRHNTPFSGALPPQSTAASVDPAPLAPPDGAAPVAAPPAPSLLRRLYLNTRAALLHSWINILLVFVPVGIALGSLSRSASNNAQQPISPVVVFAMNAIAIIPLASMLAFATECVAARLGDTVGALLNVTFGNAVELIIFIIALVNRQITVVQASLLGSILSNLLLILGMSFFFGGLRFREQIYNEKVTQMSASLLSLSVISLLVPTAFHASFRNVNLADAVVLKVSRGCSVILLLIYVIYLLFQLKSHSYIYQSTPQERIDEESAPGVLADILSSDSESSSDESDHGSVSKSRRLRRALRKHRHHGHSRETLSTISGVRSVSPEQHPDAIPPTINAGTIQPTISHDGDGRRPILANASSPDVTTRDFGVPSGRRDRARRALIEMFNEKAPEEGPATATTVARPRRRARSVPGRIERIENTRPPQHPLRMLIPNDPVRAAAAASVTSGDAHGDERPPPKMSRTAAVILLLITTGLVAACAEFLVDSIDYLVSHTPLSEAFVGLILLPIVSNAAEHVTAVTVACKNKMDLAIAVALGSSIQIALFVTPFIVLLGWMMNREMSLYFSLFEVATLFASAFIVNYLVMDGRTNYLEGALLMSTYVIIAVAAYFFPSCQNQSITNAAAGTQC